MIKPVPPDVLRKVRKLAELPATVRRSRFAVSVTRLTVLKSLCQEPDRANRFVTYLARKILARIGQSKGSSAHADKPQQRAHRLMMSKALYGMKQLQRQPTEQLLRGLWDLLTRMQAEQNQYQNVAWGAVRLITDWNLFLFEIALRCVLNAPEAGHWAYQMARDYAERYDPSHGSGLTPASAPLLRDIADFWTREFDLDPEAVKTPARAQKERKEKSSTKASRVSAVKQKVPFTHRQGQFLAFIHLYRKLHHQGPAELDMVQYFRVTPPSVHGMVVRLEELGLVTRQAGVARSVRVAIPDEEIPELENAEGRPR